MAQSCPVGAAWLNEPLQQSPCWYALRMYALDAETAEMCRCALERASRRKERGREARAFDGTAKEDDPSADVNCRPQCAGQTLTRALEPGNAGAPLGVKPVCFPSSLGAESPFHPAWAFMHDRSRLQKASRRRDRERRPSQPGPLRSGRTARLHEVQRVVRDCTDAMEMQDGSSNREVARHQRERCRRTASLSRTNRTGLKCRKSSCCTASIYGASDMRSTPRDNRAAAVVHLQSAGWSCDSKGRSTRIWQLAMLGPTKAISSEAVLTAILATCACPLWPIFDYQRTP